MAIRIFLALVALVGIMWYLAWYQKASPQQRNKSLISVLLYGIAAALLILVITGRISWVFALVSAAMPWINRALTVKRIWGQFNQTMGGGKGGPPPTAPAPNMTNDEALEILGLKPGAGESEILAAHKKLMQKIHPDRGGSDYLAAQINQAKDTLLKS